MLLRLASAWIAALACATALCAQEPIPTDPGATQDPAPQERQDPVTKQITLAALADSLARKDAEIEVAREAARTATTDQEQLEAAETLLRLQAERADLQRDFDTIATGVDLQAFETAADAQFDLSAEIESLLKVVVQELKDATAEPREISALKSQVAIHEERRTTAERAAEQLEDELELAEDEQLVEYLRQSRDAWRTRARLAGNRETAARYQLEQRLGERSSIFESIGQFLRRFFQSSGLTLLLGLAAMGAVLLVLRLLYRPVHRWLLRRHRGDRPFYLRLFAAFYAMGATAVGVLALLLVFWTANDWLLLGIALIFLLGLLWASRQTVPAIFEQIRMFLNVGSVREGERIVLGGIPWMVRSLNVYTKLVNPQLTGGVLRIPLKELIERNSRPCADHEIWFPCSEGDWVELADDVRGRVVHQSPEFVQVVLLGGARKTYRTEDFLELNPLNLSTNFRIRLAFGVDYRHQAIVTGEIPQKMEGRLRRDLVEAVGPDALIHLGVEFAEAGPSSLDVHVLADFDGSTAARVAALKRRIQRSLVDACNEHGWVIPFMQVTVHQAAPSE